MTWLDWKKEHEPDKLKFSAWQKWRRNIKPAKMRFKKGIKKIIMINRFKVKQGKALTAIQQYEQAEQRGLAYRSQHKRLPDGLPRTTHHATCHHPAPDETLGEYCCRRNITYASAT